MYNQGINNGVVSGGKSAGRPVQNWVILKNLLNFLLPVLFNADKSAE